MLAKVSLVQAMAHLHLFHLILLLSAHTVLSDAVLALQLYGSNYTVMLCL